MISTEPFQEAVELNLQCASFGYKAGACTRRRPGHMRPGSN